MARRVSWTNNSSGHLGTYVYRAPTLDPQNLPAPVATVDPVAQGETAEWVDNEAPYGCYAVQDFDGQEAGALSAEVCVTDPWANVQTGDYVDGGVYAGKIMYADGRQFHIIFALQSGEKKPADGDTRFAADSAYSVSGADDADDGMANSLALNSLGISQFPAASHCLSYIEGGYDDWYLPARNELALESRLRDHPELSTDVTSYRWESTYPDNGTYGDARTFRGNTSSWFMLETVLYVRPIRRVPV